MDDVWLSPSIEIVKYGHESYTIKIPHNVQFFEQNDLPTFPLKYGTFSFLIVGLKIMREL